MLGPSEKEEGPAAGGGSGFERGAGPGIPVVFGAVGWAAGYQRADGCAGTGGGFAGLPGRARPLHAGAEGSGRLLRGRDRGDYRNQREHGKGQAVPGATEDCGAGPAKKERRETSGVTTEKEAENDGHQESGRKGVRENMGNLFQRESKACRSFRDALQEL